MFFNNKRTVEVKVKILPCNHKFKDMHISHIDDAGVDLYSLEDFTLPSGEIHTFKLGICLEIPVGYYGMICDRSSLGQKGIKVFGGIIDSGYRGEIGVILANFSPMEYNFKVQDRIAQLLILPVMTPSYTVVDDLSCSKRGTGGFGSTGK